MRIVPAIWRRQYGLGRWSSQQGAILYKSKHERESQWAFQVFLSAKNRPRFLSKLESGPILLNIALHSPAEEQRLFAPPQIFPRSFPINAKEKRFFLACIIDPPDEFTQCFSSKMKGESSRKNFYRSCFFGEKLFENTCLRALILGSHLMIAHTQRADGLRTAF